MKILVDCTHYYQKNAGRGVDRVVANILKYMPAECRKRDIEFHPVVFINDIGFKAVTLNTGVNNRPSFLFRLARAFFSWAAKFTRALSRVLIPYFVIALAAYVFNRLKRLKNKANFQGVAFEKADILFCPDVGWYLPDSYLGQLLSLHNEGVRIVPLFYDLIPKESPQFLDSELVSNFSHWFDSIIKFSYQALAISDSTSKSVAVAARKLGRKVRPTTTYLGADFKSEHSKELKVKNSITNAFLNQRPYIVVGTLEPRKNQEMVYRAFEKLWKDGLEIKICFVGKVLPLFEHVYHQMRKIPQWESLLYVLEDVSDEELVFCYKNAKALIAPSLAEGFDLPVIEALHHSLPVMVSKIAVHQEIAQKRAIYFKPDSLLDMVKVIKGFEEGKFTNVWSRNEIQWPTWRQSITNMTETLISGSKKYNG